MATITYLGESHDCATALKGSDYIHLLDSDDNLIASFDGIIDFSGFSITDGDWTSPTPEEECYVAVVKDDGTIGKGGYKIMYGSSKPSNPTAGTIWLKPV